MHCSKRATAKWNLGFSKATLAGEVEGRLSEVGKRRLQQWTTHMRTPNQDGGWADREEGAKSEREGPALD